MDDTFGAAAGEQLKRLSRRPMKREAAQIQVLSGHAGGLGYHAPVFMCRGSSIFFSVALLVCVAGCKHYEARELSAGKQLEELESRTLEHPGLTSFLETNSRATLERTRSGQWDLDSLTWAAIYFHPSIQVAWAQWQVAAAAVKTAGGRLNPTMTVTPEYNFTPSGGASPWLPAVNFDIPIETAGKRNHRIEHARNLAEAARLNLGTAAWQVRSVLRSSMAEYAAASRRTQFLETQLEVQKRIVNLLEGRVAAGAIASIEATSARVATTRSQADLAESRRLRSDSRARIAEAIGVPLVALEKVRIIYEGEVVDLKQLSSPELRHAALTRRSDLLASLAEYAASQSALQLEIAKQYPDIHIGTGYQWDQGESKWALGVTAEIPVLNRNQGPIAEAEAKRAEAAARFSALQAKVLADIDRASSNLGAMQEQRTLLENIRAAQQKQFESLQASLKAGAADQF